MRSRIVPVALLCACLAGLAACGDSDTKSAAPTPPGRSVAPLSSAAAAEAADEAADRIAEAGGGAATGVNEGGDKGLCDLVNKAGSTMKGTILQNQKADGHVDAAAAKDAFTTFHKTVSGALIFAKTSEVTVAAQAVADEVSKAASAKDPISAAADAGFDKLSGNLTTACQNIGVKINF
jgi:hypothetical protein